MPEPAFIADVHLGKLARALRLLGFDTLYSNAYTATDLRNLAVAQQRILLSRSAAFNSYPELHALVVQSELLQSQLQQVVQQLGLSSHLRPFTRCLVCNGLLSIVSKETIAKQLEPNTRLYYNNFWQCLQCGKVYWKGVHYNRMQALVRSVETIT
jgi:uncharacterized protein with PIN domain